MKFKTWFAARGWSYIGRRAVKLLRRYDFTPGKAKRRIESLVRILGDQGCAPTFATPAVVVQAHPNFFRALQEAGIEIAVHGLYHVDLTAYPVTEATDQLIEATRTFEECGVEVHGFRNPYLGCNEELVSALPAGLFSYGSNRSIYWDIVPDKDAGHSVSDLKTLYCLYNPRLATDTVCAPTKGQNMVEIPVCLPDDLMLHDALGLGSELLDRPWNRLLGEIHQRGELFSLLFHPELGDQCQQGFLEVLREAKRLAPPVWLTRLCDIGYWWQEKSGFTVDIAPSPTGLRISFDCTPRATILSREISLPNTEPLWDARYHKVPVTVLDVPAEPRPFVGLPATAPERWIAFLREQGYILDLEESATHCAVYIDSTTLSGVISETQLIDMIETSPGPLVRYWRWPNGAKCALCISGDLDALTIFDYTSRLLAGSRYSKSGRSAYSKRISPACVKGKENQG